MKMEETPKLGRPRQYTFDPTPGITNHDMAIAASALNELRNRVIDQISDLPQNALMFSYQDTALTIGVLVVHLVWAEAGWISSLTGCRVPPALRDDIDMIGQALPAGQKPPIPEVTATELKTLCCRIGEEVTVPALASTVLDYDVAITRRERKMTPRGVLMHLQWHWAYHSGQIGLLREQWGRGYSWTFGSLGENHSEGA